MECVLSPISELGRSTSEAGRLRPPGPASPSGSALTLTPLRGDIKPKPVSFGGGRPSVSTT
eukprot:6440324-Prymnesium_polylepis.1